MSAEDMRVIETGRSGHGFVTGYEIVTASTEYRVAWVGVQSGVDAAATAFRFAASAHMLDALRAIQALAPESATHIHKICANAIAAAEGVTDQDVHESKPKV